MDFHLGFIRKEKDRVYTEYDAEIRNSFSECADDHIKRLIVLLDGKKPKNGYTFNSHVGEFLRSLDHAKEELIKAYAEVEGKNLVQPDESGMFFNNMPGSIIQNQGINFVQLRSQTRKPNIDASFNNRPSAVMGPKKT